MRSVVRSPLPQAYPVNPFQAYSFGAKFNLMLNLTSQIVLLTSGAMTQRALVPALKFFCLEMLEGFSPYPNEKFQLKRMNNSVRSGISDVLSREVEANLSCRGPPSCPGWEKCRNRFPLPHLNYSSHSLFPLIFLLVFAEIFFQRTVYPLRVALSPFSDCQFSQYRLHAFNIEDSFQRLFRIRRDPLVLIWQNVDVLPAILASGNRNWTSYETHQRILGLPEKISILNRPLI